MEQNHTPCEPEDRTGMLYLGEKHSQDSLFHLDTGWPGRDGEIDLKFFFIVVIRKIYSFFHVN